MLVVKDDEMCLTFRDVCHELCPLFGDVGDEMRLLFREHTTPLLLGIYSTFGDVGDVL